MKMHNGVQLSDVEYEELLTLAEAADNGEDVMLTAFTRLCPTGQEGAFDESVVAAYAALVDLGFIEGVQEGGEFFFEDITPAGRSLTNPSFARNRGDESALFGEAVSFDEPATFDEPIISGNLPALHLWVQLYFRLVRILKIFLDFPFF